jgi:hypothetical protein
MLTYSFIVLVGIISTSQAFLVRPVPYLSNKIAIGKDAARHTIKQTTRIYTTADVVTAARGQTNSAAAEYRTIQDNVVRVPLKYIGPYPCLSLRFPDLATNSQRVRNATGISLDFVLDTAANINTIQQQVAQEFAHTCCWTGTPGH